MFDSIWSFNDYKAFLASLIEAGPRGQVSRLAEAAGCQRSYLSNVLRTHIHLVADQAYGIARHLGLDESETTYFLLLLEKDRAAARGYKEHLDEKIRQLRLERENLAERLDRQPLQSSADQLTYYSAWYYSAVHILTSIPRFQSVSAISRALSLDAATVGTVLANLEAMSLVRRTGDTWRFHSGDIHVPNDSPMVSLHHNNWRQKAVLHSQTRKEGLHFTMVQSVSVKVANEIKERLLKLIDEVSGLAGPSESEELIYFGLDQFRIT